MSDLTKNNKVKISGSISAELEHSHEMRGEKFYTTSLQVERISGTVDCVRILVPERLIDASRNYVGEKVCIDGMFRSFNRREGAKNHLVLSVLASEIEFLDEMKNDRGENVIELGGYISKEPAYRSTPRGREITDILLAVNRSYGKSDYIPCICWGRNARFSGTFSIGTKIRLIGRIQSREYQKKLSDTDFETRTAHEVSVSRLEIVEENENEDNN